MSPPRRPLTDEEIVLPPASYISRTNRFLVRHEHNSKRLRSHGVVSMSPLGLDLFNARMSNRDKAVLIALVSKLQWFDLDYGETRSGKTWTLRYAEDRIHILAEMRESGIATTGLSISSIAELIFNSSCGLIDKLSEPFNAINGIPIDRDRASRILLSAKKKVTAQSTSNAPSVTCALSERLLVGNMLDRANITTSSTRSYIATDPPLCGML